VSHSTLLHAYTFSMSVQALEGALVALRNAAGSGPNVDAVNAAIDNVFRYYYHLVAHTPTVTGHVDSGNSVSNLML
jgi:hypothetical protein